MTDEPIQRNLGEQPIARIMAARGLRPHDVVAASGEPMTHKMVTRACKGRRLTARAQAKIVRALSAAAGVEFRASDLFTY